MTHPNPISIHLVIEIAFPFCTSISIQSPCTSETHYLAPLSSPWASWVGKIEISMNWIMFRLVFCIDPIIFYSTYQTDDLK